MSTAVRRRLDFNDFTVESWGYGMAADALAIEIGRKQGVNYSEERLREGIERQIGFQETLVLGQELQGSLRFDSKALIAEELYRQFEEAKQRLPKLGEKRPGEMIEMLKHFDRLNEAQQHWLQQYLSDVGKLMICLGP